MTSERAIPAKVEVVKPPTERDVYVIATDYGYGKPTLIGSYATPDEAAAFLRSMRGEPLAVILKVTVPMDAMRKVGTA